MIERHTECCQLRVTSLPASLYGRREQEGSQGSRLLASFSHMLKPGPRALSTARALGRPQKSLKTLDSPETRTMASVDGALAPAAPANVMMAMMTVMGNRATFKQLLGLTLAVK